MFLFNPSLPPSFSPYLGTGGGGGIDSTVLAGDLRVIVLNGSSLKVGDTRPILKCRLEDANGPVDLTGATVRFHMRPEQDTITLVDAAAVIAADQTANKGIVTYTWASGDLSRDGVASGEFQVTFGDGGRATFPDVGNIPLIISPTITN